jgi:hypothetical protein
LTIGRTLIARLNYDPDELLQRVRYATEEAAKQWG